MDGVLFAAICTGVAAVITAIAAIIRARKEGDKECHEELEVARQEAEEAQAKLHRIRMEHPEVMGDEEREP